MSNEALSPEDKKKLFLEKYSNRLALLMREIGAPKMGYDDLHPVLHDLLHMGCIDSSDQEKIVNHCFVSSFGEAGKFFPKDGANECFAFFIETIAKGLSWSQAEKNAAPVSNFVHFQIARNPQNAKGEVLDENYMGVAPTNADTLMLLINPTLFMAFYMQNTIPELQNKRTFPYVGCRDLGLVSATELTFLSAVEEGAHALQPNINSYHPPKQTMQEYLSDPDEIEAKQSVMRAAKVFGMGNFSGRAVS
jgi:hypothetical protein